MNSAANAQVVERSDGHALAAKNLTGKIRELLYKVLSLNTIRGQLTVGILAALLPCFVVGFGAVRQLVKYQVVQSTEGRLKSEAALISFGLREWGESVRDSVGMMADVPSLRELNVAQVQQLFDESYKEYPYRRWRLWSAEPKPKLLAASGTISAAGRAKADQLQAKRGYHQRALQGASSYEVVISHLTQIPCLIFAQPVYPMGIDHAPGHGKIKPNAVLTLCIPLDSLNEDTGIEATFGGASIEDGTFFNGSSSNFGFESHSEVDSLVIAVSKTGQMLFPSVERAANPLTTIDVLKQSSWKALYPLVKDVMKGRQTFSTIQVAGQSYYVLSHPVDNAWSTVLLLNRDKTFAHLNHISRFLVIVALGTTVAACLIVAQRCRSIARPMKDAAGALQAIGDGDFDVQLDARRDDEMGVLLDNINRTASRLKQFVQQATSFAVTEKQLQTAKKIQGDFLLSELPQAEHYDIAALFRPAYEIGADWYDVIDHPDFSCLIVADVCDKGVPSALYMSVFRSLTRSSFLSAGSLEKASLDAGDYGSILSHCIEGTNEYMALNHEESMMFATMIAVAVDHKSDRLTYLSAGHEPGFVLRQGELILLNKTSGPAIGIFQGAHYTVSSVDLQPDDYLFLFTDGAVDVRNPDGNDLGLEALQQLVTSRQPDSSQELLDRVLDAIDRHRDGADQFDDITLLVYHYISSKPA